MKLKPGVNLTNLLQAALFGWKCFLKLFSIHSFVFLLLREIILVQKLIVKCWWNWLQVSISPICLRKASTRADTKSSKDSQVTRVFLHFWDLFEQKLLVKCRWDWHLVLISPNFYFNNRPGQSLANGPHVVCEAPQCGPQSSLELFNRYLDEGSIRFSSWIW